MQTHIYATFLDPKSAEKAAGALLDSGVKAEDLSIIQHHVERPEVVTQPVVMLGLNPTFYGAPIGAVIEPNLISTEEEVEAEQEAKHGISTTLAGDAGIGAVKGTVWGIGIGAVAALTALFIPGVGLVLGGGALAMAAGAAAGSAGAGAIAGAVTGYLVDQGFDADDAGRYEEIVAEGGAVIAVALPSGHVDETRAWEIINKYDGSAFSRKSTANIDYLPPASLR